MTCSPMLAMTHVASLGWEEIDELGALLHEPIGEQGPLAIEEHRSLMGKIERCRL